MFWSGRPGQAASSSSGSSSSISRNEHLFSYLNHPVLKPSTRKVSSDDTIYDTVFQTTNGFALIIRVYLPADAGRAPSMTLHGVRASHGWLDIRMKVIGYSPISTDQRWRTSNLKLGDAVYAVIHHFQLTPPSILEITDANLRRLQETLSGNNRSSGSTNDSNRLSGRSTNENINFPASVSSGFQQQQQQQQQQQPNQYAHAGNSRSENQPSSIPKAVVEEKKPNFDVADYEVDGLLPPIPKSFAQIDNMPLSELKQLVDDKALLQSFVESTSEVKTLVELKESFETSNVDAACTNLENEEKLNTICTEVETLKGDLDTKMEKYRKLDAERLAITHPPDLQDAIKELNKAKKDAYRESEELGDDWVESGGEDVSDFVKKFTEVRLLYHTRAAKVERLGMSM